MYCLEFLVVNSFFAGLTFFILFLIVKTQQPLYLYEVVEGQSRDYQKSATACIIAAALYIFIGLGLLMWQKKQRAQNREEQIKYNVDKTNDQFQRNNSFLIFIESTSIRAMNQLLIQIKCCSYYFILFKIFLVLLLILNYNFEQQTKIIYDIQQILSQNQYSIFILKKPSNSPNFLKRIFLISTKFQRVMSQFYI